MASNAIHSESKIDIPSRDPKEEEEEDEEKTPHHNITVVLKEVKPAFTPKYMINHVHLTLELPYSSESHRFVRNFIS
jgi:hypothetical protein